MDDNGHFRGDDSMAALNALPDDVLLQVVAAASERYEEAELEEVSGLGCVCKGVLRQLYRLRPTVSVQVRSLVDVQRQSHGPWRTVLMFTGTPTAAVVEQARLGRVRSIDAGRKPTSPADALAPAVERRVVPELLGAGCSLLELDLSFVNLRGRWSTIFGEAAVCSEALRELHLGYTRLRGPLPELKLPSLQVLCLNNCQLTGGLEPLQSCTALRTLWLTHNQLTGGLAPLTGCTQLQGLDLGDNQLTGGLQPLQGCPALQMLHMSDNHLSGGPFIPQTDLTPQPLIPQPTYCQVTPYPPHKTQPLMPRAPEQPLLSGGLEPLKGCVALRNLGLHCNQLTGGLAPLQGCRALQKLFLDGNQLTGSLRPLQGCTRLQTLWLFDNLLSGGLEPLQGCTALQTLHLFNNRLTGGIGPLKGCVALQDLFLANNQLSATGEDAAHFTSQCNLFSM